MHKIAVIGNCQADQIKKIIRSTTKDVDIYDLPANYLAIDDDRGQFEDAYKHADFILIQYTPGNSVKEFCRHTYARQVARNVSVWPNVYFNGYTPDIAYFRVKGAVVHGPTGGYHSNFVRRKFLEGCELEDTIDLYRGPSYASYYSNCFADSLDNLQSRERECDLIASDIIAAQIRNSRVFATPDHPSNKILFDMLQKFRMLSGIKIADKLPSITEIDDLFIPANPYLLQNENCVFPDHGGFVFKRSENDFVSFPAADIVREFYKLYQAMDRQQLQNGTED